MKSPSLPPLWGIVTIQMPATLERPLLPLAPVLRLITHRTQGLAQALVLFCYTQEWKEKNRATEHSLGSASQPDSLSIPSPLLLRWKQFSALHALHFLSWLQRKSALYFRVLVSFLLLS